MFDKYVFFHAQGKNEDYILYILYFLNFTILYIELISAEICKIKFEK